MDRQDIDARVRNGPIDTVTRFALERRRRSRKANSRTITILAAVLLCLPRFAAAQTPTAAASAPPVVVAASPTVAGTITQAIASEDLQRAAMAHLEQAAQRSNLELQVTALESQFDALAGSEMAKAELADPIDLDRQLRDMQRAVTAITDDLGAVVRGLEHDKSLLDSSVLKWQERLSFLQHQLVPAPVLERARSIEAKLQRASNRVREYRDTVLVVMDRALGLQARIGDARAIVAAQQERVRSRRMQFEQSPLWQLPAASGQFGAVVTELRASWRVLRDYWVQESITLSGLFLGVLALAFGLFITASGGQPKSVQRAYGRPIAASVLLALMSLWWLAPDPPLLFYQALLVLAPIPAAMVAQRAIAAPTPMTIYGLALATVLLTLRDAIEASVVTDRLLLLLQAICIAVPIALDLRSGRLQQALSRVSPGAVRAAALLVIAASIVTAFHVIFGFTGVARAVRAGMGSVLGFGLVFGSTAVALYGAARAMLATPIASWLRSARTDDPALARALRVTVTVFAIAGTTIVALGSLGLIPAMRSGMDSVLGATLELGTVSIAVRAVAVALAVALSTLVLTGLTGFVLNREIMPRLQLRPGVGYAIVTFARWSIVVIGAVLTLAALGIDPGKVTLLAGALGVGIGFGLQTVVNNFVSGLILIIERPVGVGDMIEIGPLLGEVKRIGIRSSTVRTFQGAEVILPNGELVAKEVVNWTHSDRQRRYDIDVGVAYGSDPENVMRLLREAASEVSEIMSEPAPRAIFKGFGDSSLDFRLLAWVESVDVGLQAQTALRVAILRKLDTAGINIPFPQRDLHIHSADDGARGVTG